jgi:hypothetical protein
MLVEKEIRVIIRNWTTPRPIAGISPLVGGIGTFSVLKISLVERLYEIGLRSRSAPRRRRSSVLVESTTLLLGGLTCAFRRGDLPAPPAPSRPGRSRCLG